MFDNTIKALIGAKRKADEAIYLNENRYENPKEMFRFIASLLEGNMSEDGMDILDVGCATGEFIYYLRKKFPQNRYIGIDVSEAMIQRARDKMPTETWKCEDENILTVPHISEKQYDIVLCVGVLQMWDSFETPVANLLAYTRQGGMLYIAGSFNGNPVDVITRYRTIHNQQYSDWQLGWNLFSTQTYDKFLNTIKGIEWKWHDFKMPFAIKKTDDPMRTWTISTEANPFQLLNGASQLLDIKVLEISKKTLS